MSGDGSRFTLLNSAYRLNPNNQKERMELSRLCLFQGQVFGRDAERVRWKRAVPGKSVGQDARPPLSDDAALGVFDEFYDLLRFFGVGEIVF